MGHSISVVIVTHNSESLLPEWFRCLEAQTIAVDQVVIVDSGSSSIEYLEKISSEIRTTVHFTENIGFAAGNNRGVELLDRRPHYLFLLNPDTFITADCFETCVRTMNDCPEAAIMTGMLCGCNPDTNEATGTIDSTGIFRTWYGRWYDRGAGEMVKGASYSAGYVPAVCGAFMCCRMAAVEGELPALFDESFFMYKEDIDLSLRLRKKGWRLLYNPEVKAYHCRGWKTNRRKIPRETRLLAARNEIKLTVKHRSPYVMWALMKYLVVRVVNA